MGYTNLKINLPGSLSLELTRNTEESGETTTTVSTVSERIDNTAVAVFAAAEDEITALKARIESLEEDLSVERERFEGLASRNKQMSIELANRGEDMQLLKDNLLIAEEGAKLAGELHSDTSMKLTAALDEMEGLKLKLMDKDDELERMTKNLEAHQASIGDLVNRHVTFANEVGDIMHVYDRDERTDLYDAACRAYDGEVDESPEQD